jgi:hypothetical protein
MEKPTEPSPIDSQSSGLSTPNMRIDTPEEPLPPGEASIGGSDSKRVSIWQARLRSAAKPLNSPVLWAAVAALAGIMGWVIQARWTKDASIAHREDARNIVVTLRPSTVSLDSTTPMLVIDTLIKNIGKIAVNADMRGCELTVIEYNDPKHAATFNQNAIDWYQDDSDVRVVVNRYNLLGQYGASAKGYYLLNPGVEFREAAVVPVAHGKLYGIRSRFFLREEGGTTADFTYVYVP